MQGQQLVWHTKLEQSHTMWNTSRLWNTELQIPSRRRKTFHGSEKWSIPSFFKSWRKRRWMDHFQKRVPCIWKDGERSGICFWECMYIYINGPKRDANPWAASIFSSRFGTFPWILNGTRFWSRKVVDQGPHSHSKALMYTVLLLHKRYQHLTLWNSIQYIDLSQGCYKSGLLGRCSK